MTRLMVCILSVFMAVAVTGCSSYKPTVSKNPKALAISKTQSPGVGKKNSADISGDAEGTDSAKPCCVRAAAAGFTCSQCEGSRQ